MPRCLAMRVSCAAHSRTCDTLPGAEVIASVYMVWIESTTTISGCSRVERGDDRLELHFGEQRHRRVDQRQPLGAQRDLLDRLLAGDVERLFRRADRCHRLQQQRRLADARVAAQQDHAAGNEAAAQHPVELLDAGGKPRHVPGLDRAQRPDFAAGAGQRPGSASARAPPPTRPACSKRRSAGTGPATSAGSRRTRCN